MVEVFYFRTLPALSLTGIIAPSQENQEVRFDVKSLMIGLLLVAEWVVWLTGACSFVSIAVLIIEAMKQMTEAFRVLGSD